MNKQDEDKNPKVDSLQKAKQKMVAFLPTCVFLFQRGFD